MGDFHLFFASASSSSSQQCRSAGINEVFSIFFAVHIVYLIVCEETVKNWDLTRRWSENNKFHCFFIFK